MHILNNYVQNMPNFMFSRPADLTTALGDHNEALH